MMWRASRTFLSPMEKLGEREREERVTASVAVGTESGSVVELESHETDWEYIKLVRKISAIKVERDFDN